MRKSIVALAALTAMGSALMAGGDIEVVVPEVVVEDFSGPYAGIGYAFGTADVTVDAPEFGIETEKTVDAVAFIAGYDFNQYVAVEGRYNYGIEDDVIYKKVVETISTDSASIFVKPQYPVTAEASVYALLGYSWLDVNSNYAETIELDGFSWGLGAEYAVAENIEVFADYTSLYSDDYSVDYADVEEDIYNVTIGVKYNF